VDPACQIANELLPMFKTILLFFGLVTLLLTGLVIAGVWYYVAKGNQVAAQLADFILSHRETTT